MLKGLVSGTDCDTQYAVVSVPPYLSIVLPFLHPAAVYARYGTLRYLPNAIAYIMRPIMSAYFISTE